MHERSAHARAREREGLSAVGRAVVKVERVGRSVLAKSADQEREHVDLALGVHRLEGHDVTGGVVEKGVDATGLGTSPMRSGDP